MKHINQTSLVLLGVLPFLGAARSVYSALWISVVFTAVIFVCAVTASLLKNMLGTRARLLIETAAAAALSGAGGMILEACVPTAAYRIGISISFLAANCLVIALFEASAEKELKASVKNAAVCAFLGSAVLILSAAVRELLQNGTLFAGCFGGEGIVVFADWFRGIDFAGTSAGGLILFGLIAAGAQKAVKMIRFRHRNHVLRREMISAGCHPDLVIDSVTGKTVRRSTAAVLAQHRLEITADAENKTDPNTADAENVEAAE